MIQVGRIPFFLSVFFQFLGQFARTFCHPIPFHPESCIHLHAFLPNWQPLFINANPLLNFPSIRLVTSLPIVFWIFQTAMPNFWIKIFISGRTFKNRDLFLFLPPLHPVSKIESFIFWLSTSLHSAKPCLPQPSPHSHWQPLSGSAQGLLHPGQFAGQLLATWVLLLMGLTSGCVFYSVGSCKHLV